MTFLFSYLYIINSVIACNEAARILAMFPVPSISHQIALRPLTHELARRGHDVTVITTDPAFPKGKAPANLTEIDVHFSYEIFQRFYAIVSGKREDIDNQFKTGLSLFTTIFEKQIQCKEVQSILKDKRKTFDLLLLEAFVRPALVLSHIYKVPVIQVSSLGTIYDESETIGAPTHPFLYPNLFHQRIYNLTMREKLKEVYNHLQREKYIIDSNSEANEVIKRLFGPNTPELKELKNNVHMIFLNIHPIWGGKFPVPLSIVNMGGIHQNSTRDIPEDLRTFLDSSQHGVIYMSFGTNVLPSTLAKDKTQAIVNVLSKLPYDILLKWDNDDLPGRPKNVKIKRWFPQSDILRHPKVKLFITQGGLQSTDEAIAAGVPLLGIPMHGDQWYNVEKYVFYKIGVQLNFEDVNEESFQKAITTVIENKSYKKNIKKLSQIMRDQLQTGLERAVWWTEYVLRHGGARHLRAPAANVAWTEYYELDFILSLLVILFVIMIISCVLLYYLFNMFVCLYLFKAKEN